MLVREGVKWLGPTTDILYAVLILVIENSTKSDVEAIRVVVMKRVGPIASEAVFRPRGCITFPWATTDSRQFMAYWLLLRHPPS